MQTLERKDSTGPEVSPSDFTPEHIAVAFLMKRFTDMPREAFRDVVSLVEQWMNPKTPTEYHGEIFEAIREILFPKLVGDIRLGGDDSITEVPDRLRKRAGHIGKRIKELREEKGLTQAQLAQKSRLDQPHICRLEAGEHSPSFKTLEKIAKTLGVSVGDIDPSH